MRDSQLNVRDKQAHGSPLYGEGQNDKDRGVRDGQLSVGDEQAQGSPLYYDGQNDKDRGVRDSQLNGGDEQAHGSPLYGDGQDDKDRGVRDGQLNVGDEKTHGSSQQPDVLKQGCQVRIKMATFVMQFLKQPIGANMALCVLLVTTFKVTTVFSLWSKQDKKCNTLVLLAGSAA